MKTVIKILAGLILAFGLLQLVDLGFHLMNQPDTFVFNLGVVVLIGIFILLGFLGLYLMNVIKPEEEEEENEL